MREREVKFDVEFYEKKNDLKNRKRERKKFSFKSFNFWIF
jgi:hypothetical protein